MPHQSIDNAGLFLDAEPASLARMHRFLVNIKLANIFKGGFQGRESGKFSQKMGCLRHEYPALTTLELTTMRP
jgi:hypothetical protein